jgi:hypothetical protein
LAFWERRREEQKIRVLSRAPRCAHKKRRSKRLGFCREQESTKGQQIRGLSRAREEKEQKITVFSSTRREGAADRRRRTTTTTADRGASTRTASGS